MPIVLFAVVLSVAAAGFYFFQPKKKKRPPFAQNVTVQATFESESQARAYFQAQAGRIARTGSLDDIDTAMLAMRELGLTGDPGYDLLAQRAAALAPLVDPWA